MVAKCEQSEANTALRQQVKTLRETAPAKYGLLESHYESVRHALDDCSRSYPTTSQLQESLSESAITSQMLGNLLTLLVKLDVIGLYSDRNNSNRYDLTQYDRPRMADLSHILAADTSSAPSR